MSQTVASVRQEEQRVEPAGEFLTLHELVKKARVRLDRNAWDYLIGATETETTMRRNRMALDAIAFRPRVLRDVVEVDPSTSFLGRPLSLPLCLAPVGSIESFDPDGGAASARAAEAHGIYHMLSSVCNPGMEAVAAAADNPRMFQLYVRGDDAWVDERVNQAIACGYDAFCITVDTAHYSRRERDIAKRFVKPWRARAVGTDYQASYSWKNVERFKATHKIPLILKGIATAEDAKIACEHGVDVVYVSNHGGRQLDHGRGSMDVLPEVVDAVAGRARVMVDGSFVRGTDILKAICLGADLVGIGRLQCLALAAAGVPGLVRALELLENEIITGMGLLGVTSLDQLGPEYVQAAPVVTRPHALSGFPLLEEDGVY